MNDQLNLLIMLQEIDSSILSIAYKIESLPGRLEKVKIPLKDATASLEKNKTRYEELGKEKKSREYELEDIEVKIKKLKERTKEIKTNKEYEAHLKEIEKTEKNKYQIEEGILSTMESLELTAKELKEEEAKLKKAEDNLGQEERALEEEKKALYTEMEAYKAKRRDIVKQIGEEIYEQYIGLMKSREGIAVAPTKNEVCLGCHTNIPPQLYNDIKTTDDIFTCCYCNRILYHKPC